MQTNFLTTAHKIIATILLVLIIPITLLLIITLAGYKINKEYFSYNYDVCMENVSKKELRHCTFWRRNDALKEKWLEDYQYNREYCESEGQKARAENRFFVTALEPGCGEEAHLHKKRGENWSYLTSDDTDQYYYYCLEQQCPKKLDILK